MNTTEPTLKRSNRLAGEKSPYLLQHAHNPVDWFPWGDEAFARARDDNKPIFLSIGYSTCHWCHVMERESFEDPRIGSYLNEHFVSIKVDREERPDVDRIYMTFVQATTGSGGWPMSVFLTPDLKPFYGGTYFPPDNRHGRPGFLQVLQHIDRLWQTRRADLIDSAADAHTRLEQFVLSQGDADGSGAGVEALRHAGAQFKSSYDPCHGGFGGAPKFPHPSQPRFLLSYARRFGDDEAIRMVLHTCERMAAGGIRDHLGGGFARYAVDAQWLVPHFEKMLYDNAQLVELYLDAHLIAASMKTDRNAGARPGSAESFAAVARDVLDYVQRDITHPDGGFYSAEDADSEGHEGKFYCWTREDLAKLLTPEEFNVASSYFGITDAGNFVDHSHPHPLEKQNVLSIVNPDVRDADQSLLSSAREKMREARSRRVRPHLDDKVLASWNGLMLGAFARAYAVLGEESYRAVAERNLAFLQMRLWEPPVVGGAVGTLFHRWRDGQRDNVQLLEGYAFLLSGVIELYQATLDSRHLDFATDLAEAMLAKFYDAGHGGFWQSAAGARDLIMRVKEDYDGATPSGNSVAALALLRLGTITGRENFTEAATATLRLFAPRLQQVPQAVPYMLQALDFSLADAKRAVIAGDPGAQRTRRLLRAVHSVYQPARVVLGNAGRVEPFARTLPEKDGAVAYVCSGQTCQAPTSDVDALKQMLAQ